MKDLVEEEITQNQFVKSATSMVLILLSTTTGLIEALLLKQTNTTWGDPNNNGWHLDSEATNHIINKLNNLNFKESYNGNEQVTIDNREGLDISHTGKTFLSTLNPNQKLLLSDWCLFLT